MNSVIENRIQISAFRRTIHFEFLHRASHDGDDRNGKIGKKGEG